MTTCAGRNGYETEEVFMEREMNVFYERAVRSIAEGTDPSSFAGLFYECFQIPIIIIDEGYKLLAYANGGTFADPYWEEIVQFGAARSETITSHYLKAGYLESIANSSEAIYVDWGVSQEYPQSCGPVYVNKELEGFVSLLFMDKTKINESCRLNTMVCQLFAIFLQTSDFQKKTMRNPIRQVFARKFFDSENFGDPLDEASYRPYVDISPQYQIAAIGPLPENSSSLNMAGVTSSLNQDSSAITPSRYSVRVPSSSFTQFQKWRIVLSSFNGGHSS